MVNNCTCKMCGHFWSSRTENPLQCPRCKRYGWNIGSLCTQCEVCGRLPMERSIHHKDGNKQNNSKENQIILCKDCHNVIHNGLRKGARKTAAGEITKSRTRKYSGEEDTLIKLKELRNQWLKSKDKKAWWKKK